VTREPILPSPPVGGNVVRPNEPADRPSRLN
jgi:hypothetical protein